MKDQKKKVENVSPLIRVFFYLAQRQIQVSRKKSVMINKTTWWQEIYGFLQAVQSSW